MVRPMAVPSGSGAWFGLQVGLGLAGTAGFEELGQRRRTAWLPAAELVDHDRVLGTAWRPAVGGVGEREIVGVLQLAHVLVLRPLGRDTGTVGLATGSGFVRCLAVEGHWPASVPAASLGCGAGSAGSAWPW